MVHNLLNKDVGNGDHSEGVLEPYEMCILTQAVHNHQDSVPTTGTRKSFNEVHCDLIPGVGRQHNWLEQSGWCSGKVFVLLANETLLHILDDILGHANPE